MENYFINKQTEHQRQALDALNRALLWCMQVGIAIFYTEEGSSIVFDKRKILIRDNKIILKESEE